MFGKCCFEGRVRGTGIGTGAGKKGTMCRVDRPQAVGQQTGGWHSRGHRGREGSARASTAIPGGLNSSQQQGRVMGNSRKSHKEGPSRKEEGQGCADMQRRPIRNSGANPGGEQPRPQSPGSGGAGH